MDAAEAAKMATLEKMTEAFNNKDVDAIVANFTEDGVFETSQGPHPWGERFTGAEEIRRSVQSVFETLPDIRFEDFTRWVCGDRAVSEWTCVATTPKGRRMEVRGCDLFQFRDDKVLRKDTYFKQVVHKKK